MTNPDDSGDVKQEYGNTITLTEQGLPKPSENSLKALELELDIAKFPLSLDDTNESKGHGE